MITSLAAVQRPRLDLRAGAADGRRRGAHRRRGRRRRLHGRALPGERHARRQLRRRRHRQGHRADGVVDRRRARRARHRRRQARRRRPRQPRLRAGAPDAERRASTPRFGSPTPGKVVTAVQTSATGTRRRAWPSRATARSSSPAGPTRATAPAGNFAVVRYQTDGAARHHVRRHRHRDHARRARGPARSGQRRAAADRRPHPRRPRPRRRQANGTEQRLRRHPLLALAEGSVGASPTRPRPRTRTRTYSSPYSFPSETATRSGRGRGRGRRCTMRAPSRCACRTPRRSRAGVADGGHLGEHARVGVGDSGQGLVAHGVQGAVGRIAFDAAERLQHRTLAQADVDLDVAVTAHVDAQPGDDDLRARPATRARARRRRCPGRRSGRAGPTPASRRPGRACCRRGS